VTLPQFSPAQLVPIAQPFDSDDFLFELKMDGFRAIAEAGADGTRLVSRRGNTYKSFVALCAAIQRAVKCEAILEVKSCAWMQRAGRSFTICYGGADTPPKRFSTPST